MSQEHNLAGDQFWGKGKVDAMFPPGTGETSPVPWERASRQKSRHDYDASLVREAIVQPPRLSEVDPRGLRATQRSITRGGVEYYMGDEYHLTGETFADKGNAGNTFPVVYDRQPLHPGGQPERLLLSGHHRAAAALLKGEPLRAIHIEDGPWGPKR